MRNFLLCVKVLKEVTNEKQGGIGKVANDSYHGLGPL
jgi:hypothetical protein